MTIWKYTGTLFQDNSGIQTYLRSGDHFGIIVAINISILGQINFEGNIYSLCKLLDSWVIMQCM